MQQTFTMERRELAGLKNSKWNRAIPRVAPGLPGWAAFVDDLRENGIREPLDITPAGEVLNGWTRREAGLAANILEAECRVHHGHDAVKVVVDQLTLQKHLGKGARAYLLMPMLEPLMAEAKQRKLANLKKGHSPEDDSVVFGKIGDFRSVSDLAEHYGFSHDLLNQARELHLLFAGKAEALRRRGFDTKTTEEAEKLGQELREEWEPKILDLERPVGLGAAIAGIGGQRATNGQERGVDGDTQLNLFDTAFTKLSTVFDCKRWAKMDADVRAELTGKALEVSARWAPEAVGALMKTLAIRLDPEQRRALAEELLAN